MSLSPIEHASSLRIGTIEFVSPDEIKVVLDLEAPSGIAANSGTCLFQPRSIPVVQSKSIPF